MSKNLWPDFDSEQAPRSPKIVIEEAGAGLDEKTDGLVKFYRASVSIRGNSVEVLFTLYTRSLGYHFPFLRAEFSVDSVYPVKVVADKMTDVVANDENELIASLEEIFNAPSTVETIQKLMSLSK